MNLYQITYITRSEEETASVKDQIAKLGGRIISESSLGYKKFAYPINKELSGNYITFIFEIAPENIKKLDKSLSLDSDVIRFLIVKKKAKKEEAEAPKEELKIEKREEMLPAPEETDEELAEKAVVETEPEKEVEKEEVKPEKKGKKAKEEIEDSDDRLKKLEEKLDELLKD